MKGSIRPLLIAGAFAAALTTLLWPRSAPDSSSPPRTAPAPVAAPAPPAPPAPDDVAAAPTPTAPAPAAPEPAPIDAARASEAALMEAARARLADAPQQALALIEEADRRFGAEHEARRALEIEALVKLERIGLSHAKAERFYRAFPDSQAARRVEQLTGYHPRPWGPE